jgi:hypothetical protein
MGQKPPYRIRARVVDDEDGPAMVAGYWIAGQAAVVFSDIREDAKVSKLRIFKEARHFMNRLNMKAVCVADPGSGPFLERLGWDFTGFTEDKQEVYRWN